VPLGWTLQRLAQSLEGADPAERLFLTYAKIRPELVRRLVHPRIRACMHLELPEQYIREQLAAAPNGSMLEHMVSIDGRTSLPDNLLLCEDKMAMAAGVEIRVPYLDVELMAVAERIPGRYKVHGMKGKWLFKRACSAWVPDEVAHRKKVGFNPALDQSQPGIIHVAVDGAMARGVLRARREMMRYRVSGAARRYAVVRRFCSNSR
jgi:asparagine synthase (glutamine-hydrolysing)